MMRDLYGAYEGEERWVSGMLVSIPQQSKWSDWAKISAGVSLAGPASYLRSCKGIAGFAFEARIEEQTSSMDQSHTRTCRNMLSI